jgi:hypothetical protein
MPSRWRRPWCPDKVVVTFTVKVSGYWARRPIDQNEVISMATTRDAAIQLVREMIPGLIPDGT